MSLTQHERYVGIFADDSMSPGDVVRALQVARGEYMRRFMGFASGKRTVRRSALPADVLAHLAAYDSQSAQAVDWFNRHPGGKVQVNGEYEEVVRIILGGSGMEERRSAAPSYDRSSYDGLAVIAGAALMHEGFALACCVELDPISPAGQDAGPRLVMPASTVAAMQWSA